MIVVDGLINRFAVHSRGQNTIITQSCMYPCHIFKTTHKSYSLYASVRFTSNRKKGQKVSANNNEIYMFE